MVTRLTIKHTLLGLVIMPFILKAQVHVVNDSLYGITKDTFDIEELVVTASKVEVNRRFVPVNVSVIPHSEIQKSDESALLPVISEAIPGVFVTERGITGFGVAEGAAGQINIRGLGGSPTSQVMILIDGHPQFMGMMGHPLPDAYVTSDAEKVEVIKGPASMLYGSNAMGGVVNIITNQQKKDGYQVHGKVLYGSYNTQKYTASGGIRRNKLDVFTSINHDRTDGHRDSSDFFITNGYIKAGYQLNPQYKIGADYNIAQFEAADPGVESGLAGQRIDIMRGKTSISVSNKYKSTEGALRLYYNYGEHKITSGWHSNDDMWGIMFYQGLKLFKGNTITLGYDYMQYGGKGSTITTVLRDDNGQVIPGPNGPQFVISEYNDRWVSTNNNAFYTYTQQNIFPFLTVSAGIRYEMNEVYDSKFIPQGGIAYVPFHNTSIKISVAEGYRPPSIRELYLFPPANDILQPEQIMNYEVSWMQYILNRKMEFELTGFILEGDNLICKNIPLAGPPVPQYKNTGEIKNTGVEFALNYRVLSGLKLHSNYAYIQMDNPVIGTPEQNIYLSGRYKIKHWMFHIKLQQIMNLYGDDGSGEIQIIEKGYSLFGAKIQYTFLNYFDVFISGENLLNTSYEINYGYPMPGVTFFSGISLHLNK